MFNYIKNKLDQKIEEKFSSLRWDFDLRDAADKAVDVAIKKGPWSAIERRVDGLIQSQIIKAVHEQVHKELQKPEFVKAVVSQLNQMQINNTDLKT